MTKEVKQIGGDFGDPWEYDGVWLITEDDREQVAALQSFDEENDETRFIFLVDVETDFDEKDISGILSSTGMDREDWDKLPDYEKTVELMNYFGWGQYDDQPVTADRETARLWFGDDIPQE